MCTVLCLPAAGRWAGPCSEQPALRALLPNCLQALQSTPEGRALLRPNFYGLEKTGLMTACTELLHAWQLYRVAPSLRAPQSSRHRTGPTKVKAHQAAVRQACAGTGARRGFLHCRAAVDGADGQQPATSPSSWDTQTDRLVSVSTIFFLLLLVPQIVQNASSLMAGNSSALAALSWVVRPDPPRLLLFAMKCACSAACHAGFCDSPKWKHNSSGLLH